MLGLPILDIAIGLVFIYLVMSLACTAVREGLASLTNARVKNLVQGIQNLLGTANAAVSSDKFYDHGLIQSMYENGAKPSYIPARTFALTVLNLLTDKDNSTIADVKTAISNLPDGKAKQSLSALASAAGDDLSKLQDNIELWFNDSMDRVSAWYKRKTQWVVMIVAIALAALVNVDTLRIVDALSHDKSLRDALVAEAQQAVKNPVDSGGQQITPQQAAETVNKSIKGLENLGIPIGWKGEQPLEGWAILWKILGILVSAAAMTVGAPFWFDLLNKLITIRASGDAPNEKPKQPAVPAAQAP